MKTTLSLQDYQTISAYLDNACSPKQKATFEKRLANEPELRSTLREFAYTQRLMRVLPVRRAPRNFTLSAAQVPARPQRFFLAPALNFSALAAAALLVIVFAGSHLLPGVTSTPMTTRSISPMLASAAEATDSASSTPMIITWNQNGAYDNTAKGGAGGSDYSMMSSKALLGGGAPIPAAMQPTVTAPEATQPAATEAAPTPEAMLAMAQPEDTSHLILGLPSAEDQGKVIATSAVETTEVPTSTSPAVNFTLIEFVLGSVAVLCLTLSFLVRRLR
jgi:Predicted transmembrane transcriptional regulator (anti-sigma factor)